MVNRLNNIFAGLGQTEMPGSSGLPFKTEQIRMKHGILVVVSLLALSAASAQKKSDNKKDWSKIDLSNRPKDHFLFQVGMLSWLQTPDTISTRGLARSMNAYFVFDFPFKTDPRFSVGLGVGVGTDMMFFDKDAGRNLDIINNTGFSFRRHAGTDTANRYRNIKLTTAYLEAPVELRFMLKPETPNKSLKFALGMKIGTLVSAVDKTRYERDAIGNSAYNTKEKSRRHFNSLRLAATARVGYGNLALFGQYQVNDFIREGQGPNQIRPFTVGLTISGL